MDVSTREGMGRRWEAVFGAGGGGAVFGELVEAYTAPGRHYHDLRHVADCLDQVELCADRLEDARAVRVAVWFHDAVYDPTRPDNEARSADWAERALRGMGEGDDFIVRVHDLILDTRHSAAPTSGDGRYLVDVDLSIFGRSVEVFDAYDRAIRLEYAHVPEAEYRVGRAKVLRSFLAREVIYHTGMFRELYESAARENLARAIARLAAPVSTSR